MRLATVLIMGLTGSVALTGCGSSQDPSRKIAVDPIRDVLGAEAENARAVSLMEQGRFDEAEQALRAALALDVMSGAAHNNLGKVYFHQSKLYLAAWEFQYAIKLMPHQPEPRNNLGLVYERVGKLHDAVDWFDEARQMAPDDPEYIANLARARVRRGDQDEQLRDLLVELVTKDTRPQWVNWAKRKLALMGAGPVGEGERVPEPQTEPPARRGWFAPTQ